MQQQKELTEMERVLQKTIEDLGQQITTLTIDLSLARSQVTVMKEEKKDALVKSAKKNTKN